MGQSRLERLGMPAQWVTDDQVGVIESLSEAEFEMLVRTKQRLDDAGDDVQGHAASGGGGVVW
jgi:hypothetical protein